MYPTYERYLCISVGKVRLRFRLVLAVKFRARIFYLRPIHTDIKSEVVICIHS